MLIFVYIGCSHCQKWICSILLLSTDLCNMSFIVQIEKRYITKKMQQKDSKMTTFVIDSSKPRLISLAAPANFYKLISLFHIQVWDREAWTNCGRSQISAENTRVNTNSWEWSDWWSVCIWNWKTYCSHHNRQTYKVRTWGLFFFLLFRVYRCWVIKCKLKSEARFYCTKCEDEVKINCTV